MSRFLRDNVGSLVLLALLVTAFAAYPLTGPSAYGMTIAFAVVMHASLAVAWNILGGYSGYLSFGHVAFLGVGGYTTALLQINLGWSPIWSAPMGALVAALVAVAVGYPCLRLRGPYFAVVTLVVSLGVGVLVLNMPFIGAREGLFMTRAGDTPFEGWAILLGLMLVIFVITSLAALGIENSRMGYGLMAIREDEEVAGTQAVPTTKLKLQALTLSAGLTGLVGGIYAWSRVYLEPASIFDVNVSVLIVLFALFGGRRRWYGPVIGAAVITLAREFLTIRAGEGIAQILFGAMLVLVILFLPDGLIGPKRSAERERKWLSAVRS